MKDIFPNANTIVCMQQQTLIDKDLFEILHQAKDLQSVLNEMNGVHYFHEYKRATVSNWQSMINNLVKENLALLRKIAPEKAVYSMFALRYDIHNMKIAVKEKLIDTELDHLYIDYGRYDVRNIRSAVVGRHSNILKNDLLTDGLFEAGSAQTLIEKDFILDRLYFKGLKQCAGELKNQAIVDFIEAKADLYNLSAYFQMQAIGSGLSFFSKAFSHEGKLDFHSWENFIQGKSDDSFLVWSDYKQIWLQANESQEYLRLLDVAIDNYMMEKCLPTKLMPFGLEPICAYFFSKMMEIKNIRILLMGKMRNFDREEIKKRMRIPYAI